MVDDLGGAGLYHFSGRWSKVDVRLRISFKKTIDNLFQK